MNVTGIILAGGESSRMGSDKGLLTFRGQPLIQYGIQLFEHLQIPTLIVTNNPSYATFNVPLVKDIYKKKGPLAGIYSGMLASTTQQNIVLSCDTPFVSTEIVTKLVQHKSKYPITLSTYNKRVHPLIGSYSKECLHTFEEAITSNSLKLLSTVETCGFDTIDFTNDSSLKAVQFANLNTKEDLKQYEL